MRLKMTIAAILLMVTPAACSMSNGNAKNEYCQIAKPIYVAPNDLLSDGTARQILDLDETGKKLCGW